VRGRQRVASSAIGIGQRMKNFGYPYCWFRSTGKTRRTASAPRARQLAVRMPTATRTPTITNPRRSRAAFITAC
jgi:hypothetical protein